MNPNILVVDDSKTMRMIVGHVFSGLPGWTVATADDGQKALAAAADAAFDLIVTDINMPVMDGLSFIRALREIDRYAETPVLILTTEDDQARKLEATDLGVYAWIHKPVDPDDLVGLALELLGDGAQT
ncbi:MAG: response regulator [Comamonas sp.]